MKLGAWDIRFCTEGDLPAILSLQEVVFDALGDQRDLLRRNTPETFVRCLHAPNFTLGVFDGGELIALSIMEDARGRDDDLGTRLKRHKLSDYADYKLAFVHPAYRGHGLQRSLMALIEDIAFKRGYRWLCASVSPDNEFSRRNIEAQGFELDSRAELYGGLEREIFVKRISATGALAKLDGKSDEPVRAADVLRGKRVLIWGHGLEGKSAEAFINTHCEVASLTVYEGAQDGIDESAYDLIIKSPGIREEHWGEKYTSVTELFMGQFAAQTIGITGTKGKSTTTSLLYHVLSRCQARHTVLVGNIGIPCLDAFDEIDENSIVVFELSCHQLDHLRISPHIAVFLNLFEEHLDHYDTLERYFKAKKGITRNQRACDIFFCGEQVPAIPTSAQVEPLVHPSAADAFETKLEGEHNQFNANAVFAIATRLFGCAPNDVRAAIAEFTGLPHRLEFVGANQGIDFFDDSISTIPEATIAALESVPNAHTVLVGGMDRGIAYDKLTAYMRTHQQYRYICMYAAGKRIFDEVADLSCVSYVDDLEQAVALAKKITPAGSACLLSPAAASYGYFKNFEARGDAFRALALGE